MDLGTILCRVDKRQYPTVGHFMADVALIGRGMQQYWGDDPQGIQVDSYYTLHYSFIEGKP